MFEQQILVVVLVILLYVVFHPTEPNGKDSFIKK